MSNRPAHLVDVIAGLAASDNQVAAGLGETLQAFVAAASVPSPAPIVVEFGHRKMALGRKRMAAMNGRVSRSSLSIPQRTKFRLHFRMHLYTSSLNSDC